MLIIPVFIPHLGCPHDCCFCNQRTISGVQKAPEKEEILSIIESYRKISNNYEETQLAFFGGSFTAIPENEQEEFLSIVYPFVKKSGNDGAFIDSVRLSTRPDAISDRILERLKKYGVSTIELGAQSMDNDSLLASNRGHQAEDTERSAEMIKKAGFVLGLQTMPGLPGSTREKDIETAEKIIALCPSVVRIYPTIVIKNTKLHKMMLLGEYTPLKLEDAVSLCAVLTEMYEKASIKVIRLGLHSSENMCEERDVAGGPYHPAFGDLVYSERKLREIIRKADEKLKNLSRIPENLTVFVPKNQISTVVGNNRRNIKKLTEKYGFSKVKILPNEDYKDFCENICENNLLIQL